MQFSNLIETGGRFKNSAGLKMAAILITVLALLQCKSARKAVGGTLSAI